MSLAVQKDQEKTESSGTGGDDLTKLNGAVIKIRGLVQGIGFRPFVYRLAVQHGLKGFIRNNLEGVQIRVEGMEQELGNFYLRLFSELPSLARIDYAEYIPCRPKGCSDFRIKESSLRGNSTAGIMPDLALCPQCLKEFKQVKNRRFQYPFITCTSCGPRYSTVSGLPYDRPNTSLASFTMCSSCRQEYSSSGDRRFHAQTIACPQCGPELTLKHSDGTVVGRSRGEFQALFQTIRNQLKLGKIAAVKGVGGFQLVCSPFNSLTIDRLRHAKGRPAKPLALMFRDLEAVKKYCTLGKEEQQELSSPRAPIVLLAKNEQGKELLPDSLAPGSKRLGVMLPNTALHYLLFAEDLPCLVVTSGNLSGSPICFRDEEVFQHLSSAVDYFLTHDREIINPCDDSVVNVIEGKTVMIRRARGYAPEPLKLAAQIKPLLAVGGDSKNTFCLASGEDAFLSPHNGDLTNWGNLERMERNLEQYFKFTGISPELVVSDLHPGYVSGRWAERFAKARRLPLVRVQHHHAHLVSCWAEHNLKGPVLGVICDGTGYGIDGAVWGLEVLRGDDKGFSRLAHLEYVPMPGGEGAIKNPGRMLAGHLFQRYQEKCWDYLGQKAGLYQDKELALLKQQLAKKLNCPLTSSCGRLFDSLAFLLGLCSRATYDGEPAVLLENAVDQSCLDSYNFAIKSHNRELVITTKHFWDEVFEDLHRNLAPGIIAAKFHNGLAAVLASVLERLREITGLNRVVLSGGAFNNRYLQQRLLTQLRELGFVPYYQQKIPPGDGGLCLGQAIIGAAAQRGEGISDVSGFSG